MLIILTSIFASALLQLQILFILVHLKQNWSWSWVQNICISIYIYIYIYIYVQFGFRLIGCLEFNLLIYPCTFGFHIVGVLGSNPECVHYMQAYCFSWFQSLNISLQIWVLIIGCIGFKSTTCTLYASLLGVLQTLNISAPFGF